MTEDPMMKRNLTRRLQLRNCKKEEAEHVLRLSVVPEGEKKEKKPEKRRSWWREEAPDLS